MRKTELWKPVRGFEGLYEISSHGRIRSLTRPMAGFPNKTIRGKTLKLSSNGHYLFASLFKNRKKHNRTIHRLVGQAFLKNPKNLPQINHKNTDKTDNRVSNLEWVTVKENSQHALVNGLLVLGTEHKKSKLTSKQVREIRNLYNNGLRGEKLYSKFNISQAAYHRVVTNRSYKNV